MYEFKLSDEEVKALKDFFNSHNIVDNTLLGIKNKISDELPEYVYYCVIFTDSITKEKRSKWIEIKLGEYLGKTQYSYMSYYASAVVENIAKATRRLNEIYECIYYSKEDFEHMACNTITIE